MLEDQQLICPGCHLYFGFESTPKMLKNCKHTICINCLKNEKNCPLDGTQINISKYGFKSFLTNVQILQLIKDKQTGLDYLNKQIKSNIPNSRSNQKSFCQKQDNQRLLTSQNIIFCKGQTHEKYLSSQVCQIHSKVADLICQQENVLICSSCALFGRHKNHKIVSHEQLIKQLTFHTDNSYKIYDKIKDKFSLLNKKDIDEHVQEQLTKIKCLSSRNIRNTFQLIREKLRAQESDLLQKLQMKVDQSIKKLKLNFKFDTEQIKKNEWVKYVHKLTQILQKVYEYKQFQKAFFCLNQNSIVEGNQDNCSEVNELKCFKIIQNNLNFDHVKMKRVKMISKQGNQIAKQLEQRYESMKEAIKQQGKLFQWVYQKQWIDKISSFSWFRVNQKQNKQCQRQNKQSSVQCHQCQRSDQQSLICNHADQICNNGYYIPFEILQDIKKYKDSEENIRHSSIGLQNLQSISNKRTDSHINGKRKKQLVSQFQNSSFQKKQRIAIKQNIENYSKVFDTINNKQVIHQNQIVQQQAKTNNKKNLKILTRFEKKIIIQNQGEGDLYKNVSFSTGELRQIQNSFKVNTQMNSYQQKRSNCSYETEEKQKNSKQPLNSEFFEQQQDFLLDNTVKQPEDQQNNQTIPFNSNQIAQNLDEITFQQKYSLIKLQNWKQSQQLTPILVKEQDSINHGFEYQQSATLNNEKISFGNSNRFKSQTFIKYPNEKKTLANYCRGHLRRLDVQTQKQQVNGKQTFRSKCLQGISTGKQTYRSNKSVSSQSRSRSKKQKKQQFSSTSKIQRNLFNSSLSVTQMKKMKQQIPQKYHQMWQDAKFDKCEVVDFTGAQLGDIAVLGLIRQIVASSVKAQSLKLIRNKLSDEIMFDLISFVRGTNINSINLSQNMLTQKCLEVLELLDLGNLKHITLSLNKIVLRKVKDKIQKFKRKGITLSI